MSDDDRMNGSPRVGDPGVVTTPVGPYLVDEPLAPYFDDRIEVERGRTADDFLRAVAARRAWSAGPERHFFRRFANFLDLALEPESAESAIGNLEELYRRRVATNPGHAKRWLVAQVIWIVFGRAMELLAKVSAARAGK